MRDPSSSGPPINRGPLLVVLSGPSGVGKDAALSSLRTLQRPRHFVVTATTRHMRPGEVDGVDYLFLPPGLFTEMMEKGEFLECAQVYNNWYGVPKYQVREAFKKGLDVIMKVDVQGAATIKRLAPEAVFIFLVPSSMEQLRERLERRATETAVSLETRIGIAHQEMEQLPAFDYVVLNRDGCLEEAVECIDAIIVAEKCRIPPRQVSI